MQLKLIPVLVGALALTVTTTELAALAQPVSKSPLLLAQTQEPPKRLDRLELTQEQKDKIASIRSSTRSQIEAILTPEQREKLKAAMQDRQPRRQAFASLNLTPEQKTQMRQIRQSAKSQFEAVLTPEQRQKLQQNRQLRHQRGR